VDRTDRASSDLAHSAPGSAYRERVVHGSDGAASAVPE